MNWLRQIKATGANVPVLDNIPEVLPHARWVWEAFWKLSSRRLFNEQGPQPIPISEILAYCELTGVTEPVFRDDLLSVVVMLDGMYLAHAAKEREKARRKRQNQAQSPAPRRRTGLRR